MNETAIAQKEHHPLSGMEPNQIELIRKTVFPDSTNNELALYVHECRRRGLHPMDRQIYPAKFQGRVSFMTSIDYLRAEADRTGAYAPGPEPDIHYDDKGKIKSATAHVIKIVQNQAFTVSATALWEEYFPGGKKAFLWEKMPTVMLAKCAEALALRKAFPALGGLYTSEEMHQADRNGKDAPKVADTNDRGQVKIPLDEKAEKKEGGAGSFLQEEFDKKASGEETEMDKMKRLRTEMLDILTTIAKDEDGDRLLAGEGAPDDLQKRIIAHFKNATDTETMKGADLNGLITLHELVQGYHEDWKNGDPDAPVENDEPEDDKMEWEKEEGDEVVDVDPPEDMEEDEPEEDPLALPDDAPDNTILWFGKKSGMKGHTLMELATNSVKGGRKYLGWIVKTMGTKTKTGEENDRLVDLKKHADWYLHNVKG